MIEPLGQLIKEKNTQSKDTITIVGPDQRVKAALRVAVADKPEYLAAVDFGTPLEIEKDNEKYIARLPMDVINSKRYRDELIKANPHLDRVLKGHITLILISSTYKVEDKTKLFDDIVELAMNAVAIAESQLQKQEELTPEEVGIGHIAELAPHMSNENTSSSSTHP